MSVEVDGSGIKDGALYRDKKCKELEEILSNDLKFREYKVEREHLDENLDNDPYIVKDTEGKEIFMLEKWQIDALNPSELLSYLNVEQKRNPCVDWSERAAFNLFVVSFFVGLMFSIVSLPFYLTANYLNLMGIDVVAYSIMIGSAILYFLIHKKSNLKKHEIDLKEAESNPSFLEALQKLAAVPKSEYDYVYNEEHNERLEYIESVKAGIDL